MLRVFMLASLLVAIAAASIRADEPAKPPATKATFSITGMHCPPCARTVEGALLGVKGVRSASVAWSTKSAQVEFDEQAVSAQQVAAAVATAPHMMGSGMQYGSWLVLSVANLKDDAAAATARETLGKLPGVARVTPFVAQRQLSVQFGNEGKVTTNELLDALGKAGLSAKTH